MTDERGRMGPSQEWASPVGPPIQSGLRELDYEALCGESPCQELRPRRIQYLTKCCKSTAMLPHTFYGVLSHGMCWRRQVRNTIVAMCRVIFSGLRAELRREENMPGGANRGHQTQAHKWQQQQGCHCDYEGAAEGRVSGDEIRQAAD